MKKTIRGSRRGLTFSFPAQGVFEIGQSYTYLISKSGKPEIRIIPATGNCGRKHTISRKRSGQNWIPLIDLRSRDVLDAIAGYEQILISFTDAQIIISDARATEKAPVLYIARRSLANIRMAAGVGDIQCVDSLLSGTQITFDDWLAEKSAFSAQTIQKDLADVYTLVSLFSGAGILDWPFAQDPRFDIRYAIDYNKAACNTYRSNIGLHIVNGDVHQAFTGQSNPLDCTVPDLDIVIGGPSCKPFSAANRKTRLEDHPDSDLLAQYMRIVGILKPKVFAIENVPQVLTACDGAYYEAIRNSAADVGYQIDAKIVRDCEVGGFTTRKRAVILGSRIGSVQFQKLSIVKGFKTVRDALAPIDPTWSNYRDVTVSDPETQRRMAFVPQGGNYQSIPEGYRTKGEHRHSCTYRRLAWDEPSPTLTNWRKPPLIHPTENRTLTVAEAKALHGLPKNFHVCGSLGEKQQQVGNSVPVAIGTFIKNSLLAMLQLPGQKESPGIALASAT